MYRMNDTFGEYLDKFVLVSLDNVLIYFTNPHDYVVYLTMVLEKLHEHWPFPKTNKYEILKTLAEFVW